MYDTFGPMTTDPWQPERSTRPSARTKVFITVDTEFDIAGTFVDPRARAPIGAQSVLCEADGGSQGLGFLLETFRAHDIRATFFTEALQTAFFGEQPMGELARRIAGAAHDVQLHLHPVWTYFARAGWQERLASEAPSDHMHGRPVSLLVHWMQNGIDVFARWGLPAPVALRTGNLMVDRNVYRAMQQVGLKVASNVARALFEPAEEELRFNSGVRVIEDVVELPVLSYRGIRLGSLYERKCWTITGSSLAETVFLLDRAHACGSSAVVLLTHCHEFVKGEMGTRLKANRLNQRRMLALCRFLRDAEDRFEVTTMDRMAAGQQGDPPGRNPLLAVPNRLAAARMLQNKLSDFNLL